MTRRKILLVGEGPDELGRWFREPSYRRSPDTKEDVPGILEALLRKLDLAPWEIEDAVIWRSPRVPLYRQGQRRAPETRRVLGLAALAKDRGADVVVFARDRDRDKEREAEINAGIEEARSLGFDVPVAGAVAVEEIEAWIFALLADPKAESYARPKEKLADEHRVSTRAHKVGVVESRDLSKGRACSASLDLFCERIASALGEP